MAIASVAACRGRAAAGVGRRGEARCGAGVGPAPVAGGAGGRLGATWDRAMGRVGQFEGI
jgi:hypothetical protein